MSYDEDLAERVRAQLASEPGITEKLMFGRLMFLLDGHLAVGVAGDELLVRIGSDALEIDDLQARPARMGERAMKDWVLVARDADVAAWVRRGLDAARD